MLPAWQHDDTEAGVRVFSEGEAEATERVLSRLDKSGARTPYYAYRDSAMSRLGLLAASMRCSQQAL